MSKPAAEAKIPKFCLVNGTQLSQILGVSPQRISTLVHHGLPRVPDSRLYDLRAVVPWSISRSLEKGDVGGSGSARQQYYEAMTERAHYETAKLAGQLYGKEETDQFFMDLIVRLREELLALPERVTRERKIAADLEREITAALEGVAHAVATWASSGDDLAAASPAAAAHSGGVGKRKPKDATR